MNTAVLGHRSALGHRQGEAVAAPAEYRIVEVVAAEPASANTRASRTSLRCGLEEHAPKVAALRSALVAGSVVAVIATWLAVSGLGRPAEPELAMLLRGMAAIKGLLAVAAAGLVWWRLGRAVSARASVAYLACTCALFAATVLIWQLAFILAAAVLFHAAALVGLIVAMREGRQVLRFGRQAAHPSSERVAQALSGLGRKRLPCRTSGLCR